MVAFVVDWVVVVTWEQWEEEEAADHPTNECHEPLQSLKKQPSWLGGSEIQVQILEANPILESFGNARTLCNDNSSCFGKYIELEFKSTGLLVGALIKTYLLEKVQLIHSKSGERNYHIFYEIMEGASMEELKEYLLEGYKREDFKVMSSGTMDRRDGVKDQEEFDGLIECECVFDCIF